MHKFVKSVSAVRACIKLHPDRYVELERVVGNALTQDLYNLKKHAHAPLQRAIEAMNLTPDSALILINMIHLGFYHEQTARMLTRMFF
jgi:UV DNA damage repair endonuclease